MARALIEGEIGEAGAWMPEQVVDPAAFLSRLAARGLKVEFPADCRALLVHSRTGIASTGFAVVLTSVSVSYKMHKWTGQQQQIRQGSHDVTRMAPKQISSERRKEKASRKP